MLIQGVKVLWDPARQGIMGKAIGLWVEVCNAGGRNSPVFDRC